MSAPGMTTTPATTGGAPRLGALLRSGVLRVRSRRSLRWLTLLALLGVVGVAAIMWFTSARVGVALAVEAAMVMLALGLGAAIAGAHDLVLPAGTTQPNHQPADVGVAAELALRWLPLAVLGAAGSFAVAMLTRSTGWAIGALVGFIAVVESIIQGLWPWGSQWLLQTNAAAWLTGGLTKLVDRAAAQRAGGYALYSEGSDQLPAGYILISGTRGLATLAAIVAAACLVSWITLRQRDVE